MCEESEFLIESKLSRLLVPLKSDEQMLMKLDSIFKAIGIESEEDIHRLVKYFVCEVSPSQERGEGGEKLLGLIHPNEVAAVLRSFVEHNQGSRVTSSSLHARMTQTKGEYEELLDGAFWEDMTQVLPNSHERVWTALLEVCECTCKRVCVCFITM